LVFAEICRHGHEFQVANYTLVYDTYNLDVSLLVQTSLQSCTFGTDCFAYNLGTGSYSNGNDEASGGYFVQLNSTDMTLSEQVTQTIYVSKKLCGSNVSLANNGTINFNSESSDDDVNYKIFYKSSNCSQGEFSGTSVTSCTSKEDVDGCCYDFLRPEIEGTHSGSFNESIMTIQRDIRFRGGITPPFVCRSGENSNENACLESFQPITIHEGETVLMGILICTDDCINDQQNLNYSDYIVDTNTTTVSFFQGSTQIETTTVTQVPYSTNSSALSSKVIAFEFTVPSFSAACDGGYCTGQINITILNVFTLNRRRLAITQHPLFNGMYEFVIDGRGDNSISNTMLLISFDERTGRIPKLNSDKTLRDKDLAKAIVYFTGSKVEFMWIDDKSVKIVIRSERSILSIRENVEKSDYIVSLMMPNTLHIDYYSYEDDTTSVFQNINKNTHDTNVNRDREWLLPAGAILIIGTLASAIVYKRRGKTNVLNQNKIHPGNT
jgi:hypothetical protein